MEHKKFDVLGVKVSAVSMSGLSEAIMGLIKEKKKGYISTCPVHTVMVCRKNKQALDSINAASVATADGMPVYWVGRLKGYQKAEKISGSDLMSKMLEVSEREGYGNFFYGSTDHVLSSLKKSVLKRFPQLKISGLYAPPLGHALSDEREAVIEAINESDCDIIWVGLGSPKQDIWMARHRHRLNAPVMIAVGAAFDFLSGTKKRAPKWMQASGLEWLFRFAQEPHRLWRRYLINNFLFVFFLLLKTPAERLFSIKRNKP